MRLARLALTVLRNRLGAVPRPSWCTYLVTYRCNARCQMCDSWQMRPGPELTPAQGALVFRRLGRLDVVRPLNLGTDELISVDGLVQLISRIAGKNLRIRHDLSKPQGVRGRNSDNTLLRRVLGWEPSIMLEQGLVVTYRWIEAELARTGRMATAPSRVQAAQ